MKRFACLSPGMPTFPVFAVIHQPQIPNITLFPPPSIVISAHPNGPNRDDRPLSAGLGMRSYLKPTRRQRNEKHSRATTFRHQYPFTSNCAHKSNFSTLTWTMPLLVERCPWSGLLMMTSDQTANLMVDDGAQEKVSRQAFFFLSTCFLPTKQQLANAGGRRPIERAIFHTPRPAAPNRLFLSLGSRSALVLQPSIQVVGETWITSTDNR